MVNAQPKKYQPYQGTEDQFQMAVTRYIRYTYPYVLYTHVANERKTTPQAGRRLKLKGLKKGMPDVMIFKKIHQNICCPLGVDYSGLAIELKTGYKKPTADQIKLLLHLKKEGWQTHWTNSLDEAIEIIDNYLK